MHFQGTESDFLLIWCILKGLNWASFYFLASSRDWIGLPFILMHLPLPLLLPLTLMTLFLSENQNLFSNKQVVLIHGDGNQNIDLTKLANRMNEDTDTNLARLRKDGVSSTSIFGLIHILIGSDFLCSPRGFGPSWILKTCLDLSIYLFHHELGIWGVSEKK